MISKRDFSLFVKINSIGVIFVLFVFFFIIGFGLYSFTNTSFEFDQLPEVKESAKVEPNTSFISLFNLQFSSLCGMLSLGYFIHNISPALVKNAKHPENNIRDVALGYLLTFLTYSLVGVLGYLGFSGSLFPPGQLEVTQNALNLFHPTNVLAFIVRIACFF